MDTHNKSKWVNNQDSELRSIEHYGSSYSDILKGLGLTPTLRGPWAIVGKATQLQGWKLHLSSIPTEAAKLLSLVIPILFQWKVSFKITKDEAVLSQLNEGNLGDTQVGKFMTIYPNDGETREFADRLIDITRGFHGPIVVTDLRLGDIVYTRYGGFNPIITRDRLGQVFLSIYNPDGSLRIDSRDAPFAPPDNVANPFAGYSLVTDQIQSQNTAKRNQLFGPGYLVLETIRHQPKGSVFRAIDLRTQEQVSIKIIKQGREYCLSDQYGRDMRTRLLHQESLHTTLQQLVPIPKVDPYFEVKGDAYLPLEYIEGQTIESLAVHSLNNSSWSSLPYHKQTMFLSLMERFLTAVQKLHAAGYVHRDLTASNIWIGTDERVYLLDLELTHAVDNRTPAFGLGTLGFMSPDQEARKPPKFADDIYAIGCVMILLLTGLDPRRVLFAHEKHRIVQLLELTNGAPLQLIEIIAQCVKSDSTFRPSLETIKATVQQCIALFFNGALQDTKIVLPISHNKERTYKIVQNQLHRLIKAGQRGLLEEVFRDETSGLWLSSTGKYDAHRAMRSIFGSYEVCRDASKGVAGVIYLLGRLARFGYGTKSARDKVQQVAQWLLSDESVGNYKLPGLHFGDAGVAVAMAEVISAGLVERNSQIDGFFSSTFSGELDWPDITHGAAGQGIAAFYCADRLQDSVLLDFSHQCANYLIRCQNDDGSWKMPPGVDGMSGETLTGFAHGVSGIVYFLAEYTRRFESPEADKAWQAGATWLIDKAIPIKEGQALEWYYSDVHEDPWNWWCHGSPGIALTFLRLYEQTQNKVYAETAMKALQAQPVDIRYANLSQCHGLSGLGEIYLEASRVLGDQHWHHRASNIVNLLIHLRRETDGGSVTWLVENPNVATADLMVGSAGVIHFLLRLSLDAERIGFPLLLDPMTCTQASYH